MKVSCTHFQCAAGAFSYLREHFPQAYSVDMSRQILTLNANLMLVRSHPRWGRTVAHRSGRDKPGPGLRPSEPQVGQELLGGEAGWRGVSAVCPGEEGGPLYPPFQGQAQECLLEKSMLDNRKSFLVARISAQVGLGNMALQGLGPAWPPPSPRQSPSRPPGGGLLQRGMPRPGEPRHCLAAGPDPEGLEEAGPDEDLLLCGRGSREGAAGVGVGRAGAEVSPLVSRAVSSVQLHMGKQAEEQQKFGEQVSEPGPGGHSGCSSPVGSPAGGWSPLSPWVPAVPGDRRGRLPSEWLPGGVHCGQSRKQTLTLVLWAGWRVVAAQPPVSSGLPAGQTGEAGAAGSTRKAGPGSAGPCRSRTSRVPWTSSTKPSSWPR